MISLGGPAVHDLYLICGQSDSSNSEGVVRVVREMSEKVKMRGWYHLSKDGCKLRGFLVLVHLKEIK